MKHQRLSIGSFRNAGNESNRIMRSLAAVVGVLAACVAFDAHASGVFYVDKNDPNAVDSPTSGTLAKPYKTIASADHYRGGPGTTIIVKTGIYSGQVTVGASGTADSAYVIQAASDSVYVDGTNDFANPSLWQPAGGNTWLATLVHFGPRQVFVADSVRLDSVSVTAPESLAVNSYFWVFGQGLYVNLGGDNPGNHQTRVGISPNGFRLVNRQYVTIDGFKVWRSDSHGIFLLNSSFNTIKNNRIRYSRSHGVAIQGATGVLIDHNVVSDCRDHGISLLSGVNNCTLQDNEAHHNARVIERAAAGINVAGSSNNLLQRNNLHENEDSGINYVGGSNDNISLQNLAWNNGDHGFDHIASTGTIQIGDEAVGNYTDGISVEGGATGTQNWNCIAINNGIATGHFNVFVDSSSAAGYQSDYNIIWNSTSQKPIKFQNVQYTTVADFAAAKGFETHSFQADPLFVDAAHGNFQVQSGSKVIDSGNSGVPNWPNKDFTGHGRADDGPTPNTGVGPVTYADRGAFEFIRGGSTGVERRAATTIALGPAYPNPCRGAVSFALALTVPGEVAWSVTDIQGRTVASNVAAYPAGHASLRWSGNLASGRPAPAGIYMVRVHANGETLTRRFAIVH